MILFRGSFPKSILCSLYLYQSLLLHFFFEHKRIVKRLKRFLKDAHANKIQEYNNRKKEILRFNKRIKILKNIVC